MMDAFLDGLSVKKIQSRKCQNARLVIKTVHGPVGGTNIVYGKSWLSHEFSKYNKSTAKSLIIQTTVWVMRINYVANA